MHQDEVQETVAEEVPVEGQEEEQPVETQYVPAISLANRDFIRNNYKRLDMPSLSIATGLPPELIGMYIDAYEEYLKKNGGSNNEFANFIMHVNSEGNITFGIQWPTLEKTEQILPYLGKAMYLLQSGKLREATVQFFIAMGEEKGNYKTIKTIVNGWKEAENAAGQAPLISPHEVLGGAN